MSWLLLNWEADFFFFKQSSMALRGSIFLWSLGLRAAGMQKLSGFPVDGGPGALWRCNSARQSFCGNAHRPTFWRSGPFEWKGYAMGICVRTTLLPFHVFLQVQTRSVQDSAEVNSLSPSPEAGSPRQCPFLQGEEEPVVIPLTQCWCLCLDSFLGGRLRGPALTSTEAGVLSTEMHSEGTGGALCDV